MWCDNVKSMAWLLVVVANGNDGSLFCFIYDES